MNFNYEIAKPLLYKSRNRHPVDAAEDMLKNDVFALPPYGKISINIDNDFKMSEGSRSIWRLIHGLTFLGDLFDAYIITEQKKYVTYAEKLLFNWFDYADNNPEDAMILHDETTALRLTYLMNFNYICRDVISEKLVKKLDIEINETVNLLCTDEFHSTNTNHGMFQDISLLAYSILYFEKPSESEVYQLALHRLKDYFYSTFTSDGVHKEHSPDYHYMVTANIKKMVDVVTNLHDGNLSDDEIKLIDIYKGAEKYALHILQPNLYLPKVSDCNNFLLTKRPTYLNLFISESFRFVKSYGKEGTQPKDKQVLFKDAGYFISRSDWSKKATYFLFLASYNARYHKHSDDLSFVLYDDGDLFVDSGPNGYDYDSELTKYAYSGFAHSSLIVNDKSLPRNDGFFDKVGILDSEFENDGDEFRITGYNYRYPNVKHHRSISGDHKSKRYTINDEIISTDRNEYQLLFQLSSKVKARVNGNRISIYLKNTGEKKAEINLDFDTSIKYYEINTFYGGDTKQKSFEFPKMGVNNDSTTVSVKFYNEEERTRVISQIELSDFKVNETIIDNEKVYGSSNLKYNYYQSEKPSDSLLVVFSAMMPKYEYKYNYYNTLKDIDINQLYIKDDSGEFGSYFIGTNKNVNYETDIMSLIMNIAAKNSINFDNITLLGSSKGAFASLYFGMKYGFKNVISGAPQTQVGNFVIDEAPHKNVAEMMSGGTGEGDKRYLNNLLYGFVPVRRNYDNYFICVGMRDHHLKGHLLPYFNYLRDYEIDMSLLKIPNANHADLKKFFKYYIYESLNKIYNLKLKYNADYKAEIEISGPTIVKHNIVPLKNNQIKMDFDISGNTYNIVYYLLDMNNKIVYKSNATKNNYLIFDNDKIINHRIKIFLRFEKSVKKYITPIIRSLDSIELNLTI